ncbi:MAG: hypothetical protein HQL20_05430 [Candidatus Omnitrophica bacterium]|nr:hypothetical protein [Candidatus Omnitrophota bacterium]
MNGKIFKRLICFITLVALVATSVPASFAQSVMLIPKPGTIINVSTAFVPVVLKGMKVFPNEPLRFDFIVDTGNSGLNGEALKPEVAKIIRYFLAALTTPEKDLWVNLSPYEGDRIIPDAFGQTEMGRDLLSEDYILKQLTASLMYPESVLGKEIWKKIYAAAYQKYGTTDIPMDTFNKVWIMPDEATVYVNGNAAVIKSTHLKVMLETDYLATSTNAMPTPQPPNVKATQVSTPTPNHTSAPNDIAQQVIREIMLPVIEKEVNEGANFALLRQIYHAMVLATWFKRNLKETLVGRVYTDKNKVKGIDSIESNAREEIWHQYVESFKKGAFNYIKEETDEMTGEVIPRKYFSGGFRAKDAAQREVKMPISDMASAAEGKGPVVVAQTNLKTGINAPDNAGIPTEGSRDNNIDAAERTNRTPLPIMIAQDVLATYEGKTFESRVVKTDKGDLTMQKQSATGQWEDYPPDKSGPELGHWQYNLNMALSTLTNKFTVIITSDSQKTGGYLMAFSHDANTMYLHQYIFQKAEKLGLTSGRRHDDYYLKKWSGLINVLANFYVEPNEFAARRYFFRAMSGGGGSEELYRNSALTILESAESYGLLLDNEFLLASMVALHRDIVPGYSSGDFNGALGKAMEKEIKLYYKALLGNTFEHYWGEIVAFVRVERAPLVGMSDWFLRQLPEVLGKIEALEQRELWERIMRAAIALEEMPVDRYGRGRGDEFLDAFTYITNVGEMIYLLKSAEAVITRNDINILHGAVNKVRVTREQGALVEPKTYVLGDAVPPALGRKMSGFEEFNKMGLAFPEGVGLSLEDVVRSPRRAAERVVEKMREIAPQVAVISVRSSPSISMPGMLDTELDVPLDVHSVESAIMKVLESWYDLDFQKALEDQKDSLEAHAIVPVIGLGIIFQRMVDATKDVHSGSGVVVSHNMMTGEARLNGRFGVQVMCKGIVSAGTAAGEINELQTFSGTLYEQLTKDIDRLTKQFGLPVEVEFTVESDKLYYLQVRPAAMGLKALAVYLKGRYKGPIPSELIPHVMEAVRREAARPVMGLKAGIGIVPLAHGDGVSGGVAVGRLSFGEDPQGILVLTAETVNSVHIDFKQYKGFLTHLGSEVAHVAVKARAASLPGIVRANGLTVDAQARTVSFPDGQVIKEGEWIGLDSDTGAIFVIAGDGNARWDGVLEVLSITADLTHGQDYLALEREILAKFDRPEVATEELLQLNVDAQMEYESADIEGEEADMQKVNLLNARKNFLHNVWKKRTKNDPEGRLTDAIEMARQSAYGGQELRDFNAFITDLKEVVEEHGRYRIKKFMEQALAIYDRAPANVMEVERFLAAFGSIQVPSAMSKDLADHQIVNLMLLRQVIRGIYVKLLTVLSDGEQLRLLAEGGAGQRRLLSSVSALLGRPSALMVADLEFFASRLDLKERMAYIIKTDQFKVFNFLAENYVLQFRMDVVEEHVKRWTSQGIMATFFWDNPTFSSHTGGTIRNHPAIFVPMGMIDAVRPLVWRAFHPADYDGNIRPPTEQDWDPYSGMDSVLRSHHCAIDLKALAVRLGEDDSSQVINGGIDFSANELRLTETGGRIDFGSAVDPAMLDRQINGFTPVIFSIIPMADPQAFFAGTSAG